MAPPLFLTPAQLSEALHAAQIVVEDHYLSNLHLHPLTVVGVEGVLGVATMLAVVLPLAQHLPGADGKVGGLSLVGGCGERRRRAGMCDVMARRLKDLPASACTAHTLIHTSVALRSPFRACTRTAGTPCTCCGTAGSCAPWPCRTWLWPAHLTSQVLASVAAVVRIRVAVHAGPCLSAAHGLNLPCRHAGELRFVTTDLPAEDHSPSCVPMALALQAC